MWILWLVTRLPVGGCRDREGITGTVRDACLWAGVLCFHTHDSRRARGRVTAEQRTWLDRLSQACADADVWRPTDWPDRVLDELAGVGGRCLPTTQNPVAS